MKLDELKSAVLGHIDELDKSDVAGGDEPKPEMVKLQDKRKKIGATGFAINKDKDLKSGDYDMKVIKNVIKAAKHEGVDPNTALSVALQETHLGKLNPENLGNVYQNYNKIPEGLDRQAYEMVATLKAKMAEGKKLGFKEEAMMIQMYNGMGKLKPQLMVGGKIQPQKFYGIEVTAEKPLDLRKNPLYGKTIIDLRDNIIKQNPQIQQLIHGQ